MTNLQPLKNFIDQADKSPIIVSHRGEWQNAPENSLEAVLQAIDAGAHMVEIDTQASRDGTLFLLHDETVDRTTSSSGHIGSLSDEVLDDLQLKQGSGGNGASVSEHRLGRLKSLLEAVRDRVYLNIDTKDYEDLQSVGDLVFSMNMQDQVLVKMTVDPEYPDQQILNAPWFGKLVFMPVMLDPVAGRLAEDCVKLAKTYHTNILEISFPSLGELQETSDALSPLGVRLWCNTLDPVHPMDFYDSRAVQNPSAIWGELLSHGVSIIQTDFTSNLANFIAQRWD